MRNGTYLNVILTVNAVLLAALVWVQVTGPAAPQPATAVAGTTMVQGIPNAGAQRERMVRAIQSLEESVNGVSKTLAGGKLAVRVENLDEIDVPNN